MTDAIGPGAFAVVRVTASDEVRAQRLRARRREPEPGIGQRLARPDPAPAARVSSSSARPSSS